MFELDSSIDDQVARSPEVTDAALLVAQEIADAARGAAPRGESGNYAAGIRAEKTKFGARVFSSDRKSAWIEFGVPARNIRARFILRNAAANLGFKFKKGR